ncbi:MAG: glutathione S-transferase family protein, partial [Alphaproteobacteria bacterium]
NPLTVEDKACAVADMTDKHLLLCDYPSSICSQMARLALEEKGLTYERRTVDIMDRAEQFEPWYTALNPRAVVPTLAIDDEIVTDTITIVHRVDSDFTGASLTPAEPEPAAAMVATMRAVMGLHYGVLLYQKKRNADGIAPTVVARGEFLRAQRRQYPERAELLDRRIAGNENMQRILADSDEVALHVGEARGLVETLNTALAQHRFVAADTYSLADTFATAALARFRVHGFADWWSGGENGHVADYYARVKARPSWERAAVVDTGTEANV